jgi:hypothetical protein
MHLRLFAELLGTDWALVNPVTLGKISQVSAEKKARQCDTFQRLQKAQHSTCPRPQRARLSYCWMLLHGRSCLRAPMTQWAPWCCQRNASSMVLSCLSVSCLRRMERKFDKRRSGTWSEPKNRHTVWQRHKDKLCCLFAGMPNLRSCQLARQYNGDTQYRSLNSRGPHPPGESSIEETE